MGEENKKQVQKQFGPQAGRYITSPVHAGGGSLARLRDLVQPQPGWHVLDVATGGAHTARAFASHVSYVVAGDITRAMLDAARASAPPEAISFCQHDGEALPFMAGSFDCVTCRIAPHHFPQPLRFVQEAARVLKPGGVLAVADNITSGDPETARFVNIFEKLRDPSHQWAYTEADWDTFLFSAGLEVTHVETLEKDLDFDEWAARMGVSGDALTRLLALLVHAPGSAREWLRPRQVGRRTVFTLTEIIITGRKPRN